MIGKPPKGLVKRRTFAKKIKEEFWNAMEDSKKVRDRLTFNLADNTSKEEMNQEHFKICEGTEHERRGLDMGTWRGLLDFWRRLIKKLGATAT